MKTINKYSRSFSIGIILLLGLCALTWSFKVQKQNPTPQKYTCTLSLQEWQNVIFTISNPDDVSANQRKQIVELVNKNLVAVDTTKKK